MHESAEQQRARLAYEASLRALDQQRRSLEEIRARTGVLLAAAALSASFLGARAFDRHASAIIVGPALAALLVALLLGLQLLALRDDLVFSLSGPALHAELLSVDGRADQHRSAADWLDEFWRRNEPSIQRQSTQLRVVAGALALQMVLWTIALVPIVGGPS